jgi:hypothetical protein
MFHVQLLDKLPEGDNESANSESANSGILFDIAPVNFKADVVVGAGVTCITRQYFSPVSVHDVLI